MTALTSTSVVHFYDTSSHRILCGVRGADHRSTKHSRGVTCHACVGLLAERPMRATGASDAVASAATP